MPVCGGSGGMDREADSSETTFLSDLLCFLRRDSLWSRCKADGFPGRLAQTENRVATEHHHQRIEGAQMVGFRMGEVVHQGKQKHHSAVANGFKRFAP